MNLYAAIATYSAESEPGSRTPQKLLHNATSWLKRGGPVDITRIDTTAIETWRRRCHHSGLSATTIETTISDLLVVLRHFGLRPDPGKRLKKPRPRPVQPTPDQIARLYLHTAVMRRWPDWCDSVSWWRAWIIVSFWTGLRIGDVRKLVWDNISGDVLSLDANKTALYHSFPLPPFVLRHLEPLRGRETIFGLSLRARYINSSFKRYLSQLRQTASINITPKRLRRASITAWTIANPVAGQLVHGTGLPRILNAYVDASAVIREAMGKFRVPMEFLTPAERRDIQDRETHLVERFRALAPENKSIVVRICDSLN